MLRSLPIGRSSFMQAARCASSASAPATKEQPLTSAPRTRERAPVLPKPLADDGDYTLAHDTVLVKRPAGYSFGGGPGAVRDEVKLRAAQEMVAGGLLEMSHREKGPVHEMLTSTQQLLRDLLDIPKEYEILFIQGGAHAQFSAVPLNFGENPRVVTCVTGSWSAKATAEQARFSVLSEYRPAGLTDHEQVLKPFLNELESQGADYGYLCTNETMQGIQLKKDELLKTGRSVLVSDSTSDLLSRRMDFSKYGVVFASGGKNLGPSGFAVVVVKKDILDRASCSKLPSALSWKEFAYSKPIPNLYNTPPLVSLGLAKMVLDDLALRGGVEWAEKRNRVLAQALYEEIDSSNGFYCNTVSKDLRSNVSVIFGIPHDPSLEGKFVKQAEMRGLLQLVNHPSVGGMRASIYNTVPVPAVELLIKFMREFRKENSA